MRMGGRGSIFQKLLEAKRKGQRGIGQQVSQYGSPGAHRFDGETGLGRMNRFDGETGLTRTAQAPPSQSPFNISINMGNGAAPQPASQPIAERRLTTPGFRSDPAAERRATRPFSPRPHRTPTPLAGQRPEAAPSARAPIGNRPVPGRPSSPIYTPPVTGKHREQIRVAWNKAKQRRATRPLASAPAGRVMMPGIPPTTSGRPTAPARSGSPSLASKKKKRAQRISRIGRSRYA